ncbi:hypothetical protein DERP_009592 [Dermatophagoides pteronyssinus]|uniref:Uncharacterized protein n=1 Tax=Dermatophagoides pteronyssinus TaxID=6956 RepID=A0ABQ8JAR9_DERPT|nr:hypothetical protein DERP_009592 [Dermatophagoides pteronyssinus]
MSSVSSTCTTALAPAGTAAPVLIRAQNPRSILVTSFNPAIDALERTLRLPFPSSAITAYPSLVEASNGGNGTDAKTS